MYGMESGKNESLRGNVSIGVDKNSENLNRVLNLTPAPYLHKIWLFGPCARYALLVAEGRCILAFESCKCVRALKIIYNRYRLTTISGGFVMSAKDLKALTRRFIEEWNKGKAAAMAVIDEMYAINFVSHGDKDIRGIKNVKQSTSEEFSAFPDLHFTIDDMFAEGDKVAARITMTGTHKGEYMGAPPTNKKITIRAIAIERFAGGKIVEEWGVTDTLGLMQQLGVVPTPKKEK